MKNAPWIRKIYIVTNGQIPKWLDLSKTDKIEIITHEQIMPRDSLPTFNSQAIESCICNIPNLSEHFLLANDDCYINKPVTQDFFFTKKGLPIVRLKKIKLSKYKLKNFMYNRSVQFSNDLINQRFNKNYAFIPHHNIDAYSKSMYINCIETFKKEFDKMIYSQFRAEGVQRVIVALYMLVNDQCKLKCIKKTKFYKHEDSFYIEIEGKQMLDKIVKSSPNLLCLNDSCRVKENDLEDYQSFLAYLYPERQMFEKEQDYVKQNVIDFYKNYAKKFNWWWKLSNKINYLIIFLLRFLLSLFVRIDKDEEYKTFLLFNFIQLKIKRKK